MLRFDLELDLLGGNLSVSDLPEAWAARSREYLGITPPDNSRGVLQDVHWSGGMFGYFPTYALGNVISAQLWETAHKDIPDLDDQIRLGHLGILLEWLRLHVHQFGRKFEPQELVRRATGSRIDPSPYLRYLQGKYGELYGL
jgi:carboxypeptidase Taq